MNSSSRPRPRSSRPSCGRCARSSRRRTRARRRRPSPPPRHRSPEQPSLHRRSPPLPRRRPRRPRPPSPRLRHPPRRHPRRRLRPPRVPRPSPVPPRLRPPRAPDPSPALPSLVRARARPLPSLVARSLRKVRHRSPVVASPLRVVHPSLRLVATIPRVRPAPARRVPVALVQAITRMPLLRACLVRVAPVTLGRVPVRLVRVAPVTLGLVPAHRVRARRAPAVTAPTRA